MFRYLVSYFRFELKYSQYLVSQETQRQAGPESEWSRGLDRVVVAEMSHVLQVVPAHGSGAALVLEGSGPVSWCPMSWCPVSWCPLSLS